MKFEFDHELTESRVISSHIRWDYVFHNITIWPTNGPQVAFQTGVSYIANDYDCPNEDIEPSPDACESELLDFIEELEKDPESDIEFYNDGLSLSLEGAKDLLEEITKQANEYFEEVKKSEGLSDDPEDYID